ncbi:hypothetical protein BDV12DRAFT_177362 [Aspergillus spectabilis]
MATVIAPRERNRDNYRFDTDHSGRFHTSVLFIVVVVLGSLAAIGLIVTAVMCVRRRRRRRRARGANGVALASASSARATGTEGTHEIPQEHFAEPPLGAKGNVVSGGKDGREGGQETGSEAPAPGVSTLMPMEFFAPGPSDLR